MKLKSATPGKFSLGFSGHTYSVATLAMIMLATASLITSCVPSVSAAPANQVTTTVNAAPAPNIVIYDENALTSLYEKSIPAVVMMQVTIGGSADTTNPFGGFGNMPQQRGQGSGFIIDNDGHILTNNHVVEGATKIKVLLHNGKSLDAQVVGTDKENDLGLIKVDPQLLSGIVPLKLGNSDALKPGQMAIALGSPYGLEGSITAGLVSGTDRSMPGSGDRTIANVIQTDAAINPGNSGGPLMNSAGEVIGINTAIEPSSNSIGFCIPINTAKNLLPALLKGGEVKTAWLGISGVDISDELATTLNLPVKSGVYVVTVTPNGPADKAGIKASGQDQQGLPGAGGDIIVAVDGKPVAAVQDMIAYFNGKAPGDKITLSIYRDGKAISVDATLGEWPGSTPTVTTPQPRRGQTPTPYIPNVPNGPTVPNTPNGNGFDFGPFHWNWNWKLPIPTPRAQPGN